MKLAVLYPKTPIPVIDQVVVSWRPNEELCASASIACSFGLSGTIPVVTPVDSPGIGDPRDWVFGDDMDGIRQAISRGADAFFLNIPLYSKHAITSIMNHDFCFIGQRIVQGTRLGNRFYLASILQEAKYSHVQTTFSTCDNLRYDGSYPAVAKPVRKSHGRGIRKVDEVTDLRHHLWDMAVSGSYGRSLVVQPFLPGREISVPVFPRGLYPDGLHDSAWSLPPILKIDHINGIFPKHYVPVMADLCMQKICKECESIVDFFNVKGPVCFECRQDDAGEYQIFDMDLQPDLSLDFPFKKRNIQNLFLTSFLFWGKTQTDFLNYLLCTAWPGEL